MSRDTQGDPGRWANTATRGLTGNEVRLMSTVQDTRVDIPPVTDPPPPVLSGVVHWYGRATGSWWALVPGREGLRLVEAVSADALAVTVDWYLRLAAQ